MTRDQVNRILSQMESIRMDAMAESAAEERRLDREYGRLWASIEPYVSGKRPYTDDAGPAPSRPQPPASPPVPPRTPEDGQRPATPEDGRPVTTR
jgi:hypothetical protein